MRPGRCVTDAKRCCVVCECACDSRELPWLVSTVEGGPAMGAGGVGVVIVGALRHVCLGICGATRHMMHQSSLSLLPTVRARSVLQAVHTRVTDIGGSWGQMLGAVGFIDAQLLSEGLVCAGWLWHTWWDLKETGGLCIYEGGCHVACHAACAATGEFGPEAGPCRAVMTCHGCVCSALLTCTCITCT